MKLILKQHSIIPHPHYESNRGGLIFFKGPDMIIYLTFLVIQTFEMSLLKPFFGIPPINV